jgi:hypothetical protein
MPESAIQRLNVWFKLDYEAWKEWDLSGLEVVYWWTHGLVYEGGHPGPYECAAHARRGARTISLTVPLLLFSGGDVNRINS